MTTHQGLLLTAVVVLALAMTGCQGDAPTSTNADGGQLAAAQSEREPARVAAEGVTVTGAGRVTGTPDTLRATVGVEVTRDQVDQAFKDANAAADEVLAALRDHGVAKEDIQTREFSVHPRREEPPEEPDPESRPGEPRITGYTVTNLVEATIRDVDTAGEVLGAVADAGGDAVRIEGVEFSLQDNAAQLKAARKAALEDARAKAEHYANLAGRELGQLISLTEIGADEPAPVDVGEDQAAAPAPPPIRPGTKEITVRVQTRWTLN